MSIVLPLLFVPLALEGSSRAAKDAAAFIPVFIAIAVLSIRYALAGARPEPDGLRVRNILHTHLIPWDDIEGNISLETWRLLPAVPVVHVRGGKRIAIIALERGNPMWELSHRMARRWLDVLNASLASARYSRALADRGSPQNRSSAPTAT